MGFTYTVELTYWGELGGAILEGTEGLATSTTIGAGVDIGSATDSGASVETGTTVEITGSSLTATLANGSTVETGTSLQYEYLYNEYSSRFKLIVS